MDIIGGSYDSDSDGDEDTGGNLEDITTRFANMTAAPRASILRSPKRAPTTPNKQATLPGNRSKGKGAFELNVEYPFFRYTFKEMGKERCAWDLLVYTMNKSNYQVDISHTGSEVTQLDKGVPDKKMIIS